MGLGDGKLLFRRRTGLSGLLSSGPGRRVATRTLLGQRRKRQRRRLKRIFVSVSRTLACTYGITRLRYHVPTVSRTYGITYLGYHVPTRSDERMSIASKCSWGCPYGRPERSCPFHWAARARRPAPVGSGGRMPVASKCSWGCPYGRPERGVLRQQGPGRFGL